MSLALELVDARAQVAAAAREVAARGLVAGSAGNVSLKLEDALAVTPGGIDLCDVGADDVVVLDRDGGRLAGAGRPSSEAPLHRLVAAPAVVHTHSHYATVLSCCVEEVPSVHYLTARLGGPVGVARYATFGTPELAANVDRALAGRHAALLQNHGAVAVGSTLVEAVERAQLLEWLCRVAFDAKLFGSPHELSAEQIEAAGRHAADLRYGERG